MVAMTVYLVFDFAVIVLLFAMIFRFLPDAKIQWRDVWIGAVMTAILFGVSKRFTRFVPRQRCCWVGLWTSQFSNYIVTLGYYWSQILLFGAEFTQVSADRPSREVNRTNTRCASRRRKSRRASTWRWRPSLAQYICGRKTIPLRATDSTITCESATQCGVCSLRRRYGQPVSCRIRADLSRC
jgi:Virulence factor BrkB